MTPEPPEDWLDRVAGRKVDPETIRWLRQPGRLSEPERRRLEAELAFNGLLDGHRPPPPVSSNFTAQVLARIEREERVVERRTPWWQRIGWLPRLAALAAVDQRIDLELADFSHRLGKGSGLCGRRWRKRGLGGRGCPAGGLGWRQR